MNNPTHTTPSARFSDAATVHLIIKGVIGISVLCLAAGLACVYANTKGEYAYALLTVPATAITGLLGLLGATRTQVPPPGAPDGSPPALPPPGSQTVSAAVVATEAVTPGVGETVPEV